MKNGLFNKIVFTSTAVILTLGVVSCGNSNEAEKSEREKVLEYLETLGGASTGINTFETEYDDMVDYLKESGVITSTSDPIDINKTAGYVKKYDGTFTDVVEIADKAYQYGDVSLIWWNLSEGSQFQSTYTGLINNKTIVVGGGQYSMAVTQQSGCYAISFESVSKVDYETVWDDSKYASYEEFTTAKQSLIEAEKGKLGSRLTTFTAINNATSNPKFFTSLTELSTLLQKSGFITIQDLASPKDLNTVYNYGTTESPKYAKLASEAKQYGNIIIYFYNQTADFYSYSTMPVMLKNLTDNKETNLYYDGHNNGYDWYTESDLFKVLDGQTTYDAGGNTVTFDCDIVLGNFAIKIVE